MITPNDRELDGSARTSRPMAFIADLRGRQLGWLLNALLLGGFVVVLLAWVTYLAVFGADGVSRRQDVWGQVGDFVGGVSNPLLSFFGLIALLSTVKLQSAQLDAAREELEESRRAQADSARLVTAQLATAQDLALSQQRTAQAMERAADAQEASADTLRDQLKVAHDAAHAQLRLLLKQIDMAEQNSAAQAKAAQEQIEHTRALVHAQHRTAAAQELAAAANRDAARFHAMDSAIRALSEVLAAQPKANLDDALGEQHLKTAALNNVVATRKRLVNEIYIAALNLKQGGSDDA